MSQELASESLAVEKTAIDPDLEGLDVERAPRDLHMGHPVAESPDQVPDLSNLAESVNLPESVHRCPYVHVFETG